MMMRFDVVKPVHRSHKTYNSDISLVFLTAPRNAPMQLETWRHEAAPICTSIQLRGTVVLCIRIAISLDKGL